MHRVLFSPSELRQKQVDHVNGDKWDNRRSNLRLVTKQQNQRNRRFQKNANKYGRGVSFDKRRGKFMAYCHSLDGKMLNLGTFTNVDDARAAARQGRIDNGYLNVECWT